MPRITKNSLMTALVVIACAAVIGPIGWTLAGTESGGTGPPTHGARSGPRGAALTLPKPRLLSLSYGLMRPGGAPHAYWGMKLIALQSRGQIVDVRYSVEPGGREAVGDSECGLAGRRDGQRETFVLPLQLPAGTYQVTVAADGTNCQDRNLHMTRALRTFRIRVQRTS